MYQAFDNISDWIENKGHHQLTVKQNFDYQTYGKKTLQAINKATVNCTTEKVMVHGVEKTCRNYQLDHGNYQIDCNIDRLTSLDDTLFYQISLHELNGLSGYEVNKSAKSNYRISQQISHFVTYEKVPRLAVNKIKCGPEEANLRARQLALKSLNAQLFLLEQPQTNESDLFANKVIYKGQEIEIYPSFKTIDEVFSHLKQTKIVSQLADQFSYIPLTFSKVSFLWAVERKLNLFEGQPIKASQYSKMSLEEIFCQ